jgi:hypothetical protein
MRNRAASAAGAGDGGAPRVNALSGRLLTTSGIVSAQINLLADFFAGDPASRGGIRVAAKVTGFGTLAALITGSGDNQPSQVRSYFGTFLTQTNPVPVQIFDPYGLVLADGVFVG